MGEISRVNTRNHLNSMLNFTQYSGCSRWKSVILKFWLANFADITLGTSGFGTDLHLSNGHQRSIDNYCTTGTPLCQDSCRLDLSVYSTSRQWGHWYELTCYHQGSRPGEDVSYWFIIQPDLRWTRHSTCHFTLLKETIFDYKQTKGSDPLSGGLARLSGAELIRWAVQSDLSNRSAEHVRLQATVRGTWNYG